MGSGLSPEETIRRYVDSYFDHQLSSSSRTFIAQALRHEHPQHQVTISKAFYLQTTEVTQRQWRQVMGGNPSHFQECGEDCPVESVSWNEAQEFIKKLNRMEETDQYRLPTEAEWEYSCRAGSISVWCFGDNEVDLGEYAWYQKNSGGKTHPVGQLSPNAWGLYDMHGNVVEYCLDFYKFYPAGPFTELSRFFSYGWDREKFTDRDPVLRSGSYADPIVNLRSASRDRFCFGGGEGWPGGVSASNIGFRVARTLDSPSVPKP
jgi:formylglycine-generating enzyme required for sulfatase activity